ncbi:hypothetical protein MBLNU459_g6077t1 [Dothideomycetes sp. NU459]
MALALRWYFAVAARTLCSMQEGGWEACRNGTSDRRQTTDDRRQATGRSEQHEAGGWGPFSRSGASGTSRTLGTFGPWNVRPAPSSLPHYFHASTLPRGTPKSMSQSGSRPPAATSDTPNAATARRPRQAPSLLRAFQSRQVRRRPTWLPRRELLPHVL